MTTDTLANSLRRIAVSLSSDAEELNKFAAQLDDIDAKDLEGSAIHSNVVLLVGRTMNNSSWIAAAESALHSAAELSRGE